MIMNTHVDGSWHAGGRLSCMTRCEEARLLCSLHGDVQRNNWGAFTTSRLHEGAMEVSRS